MPNPKKRHKLDITTSRCSFCGKTESKTRSTLMIGNTGLKICDKCLELPGKQPPSASAHPCSICRRIHYHLRTSIYHPDIKVCEECIQKVRKQYTVWIEKIPKLRHCSFCMRPEKEVDRLFAGDRAYICNECIAQLNVRYFLESNE